MNVVVILCWSVFCCVFLCKIGGHNRVFIPVWDNSSVACNRYTWIMNVQLYVHAYGLFCPGSWCTILFFVYDLYLQCTPLCYFCRYVDSCVCIIELGKNSNDNTLYYCLLGWWVNQRPYSSSCSLLQEVQICVSQTLCDRVNFFQLLWVDLIKWASNVRPYVRPSTKIIYSISMKFGV